MTFNNTTPVNFLDAQSNGRASSSPFVDIFQPRDPTPQDITTATAINNYAIQQKWLNTTTNALWELKNYTTSGGVLYANWIMLANHALVTESLRDQTGIDVFPDVTNEINFVGDGVYVITTGTPSTNTMTVSVTGAITTLYTENTGTATPMAGNLNVLGSGGITTTGSGNTITISPSGGGTLFTGDTVDAHTAPGTNPVVPNGSGLITVTGGQVAAGTTTNVIRTDSLAANTFTIEVQRSQAVASTTIGDNGVSHFNSANFTVDANGFVSVIGGLGFSSVKNQVFTTTGTYTPTAGMAFCQIELCGGGGGSGGTAITTGAVAVSSSGGAGGYARGIFSAATIGASKSVTIGAGGTAGAAGNNAGGTGGTTSVGALISATGGSGGAGGAAGAGVSAAPGANGGTGTGGDVQITGGSGGLGTGVFSAEFVFSGSGGASYFGGGPSGANGTFGIAGIGFGTGASGTPSFGAAAGQPGAAGAPGVVIIQEYILA